MGTIINVALPKGRLGEKVYKMFEAAGYGCEDIFNGRKLVFENLDAGIRYFWVKPSDVPIYVERGAAIDIIKLNGSIEIAPILGLSDVIVDLVETGNTLRANDLEVYEEIMDISTRLITNKSGYNFKSAAINRLLERL